MEIRKTQQRTNKNAIDHTVTEVKNAFDEIISTLDMAEGRSSEPEDSSVEIIIENKY